jgi:hypothetical protein
MCSHRLWDHWESLVLFFSSVLTFFFFHFFLCDYHSCSCCLKARQAPLRVAFLHPPKHLIVNPHRCLPTLPVFPTLLLPFLSSTHALPFPPITITTPPSSPYPIFYFFLFNRHHFFRSVHNRFSSTSPPFYVHHCLSIK